MKLWSKDNTVSSGQIENFTVGRDKEFDLLLAEHDVTGTIAHVTMLKAVGLMPAAEADSAVAELKNIQTEISIGDFAIEEGIEDIHSQIELMLT
ncbi:MAG TPA: hypothetical protein VK618_01095, partial [Flavitalea sp.]|nr:hypothetical protein [Flavitalea sp.]